MKKHQKATLLFLCLAAVAAVCWWFNREPRVGGHTLSYWLELHGDGDTPPDPQAQKAIANIGCEALPLLLQRIRSTMKPPPRLAKPMRRFLYRLPNACRPESLELWLIQLDTRNLRNGNTAAAAFAALGEKAAPALPELARLATAETNARVRSLAIAALAHTGTPGVTVLLKRLEAPGTTNHAELLLGFRSSESLAANPALVPAFVRFLASTNEAIQCAAASCLGYAQQQPDLATDALVSTLRSSGNITLLCHAARSLGRLGPGARSAVPDLVATAHKSYGLLLKCAVAAIANLGPEYIPTAPAATNALDPAAILAQLPQLSTNTPERAVALRLLQQGNLRSQLTAAFILTSQGQAPGPLMPIYLTAMSDRSLRG